jgi:hypothetical protein
LSANSTQDDDVSSCASNHCQGLRSKMMLSSSSRLKTFLAPQILEVCTP